MPGIASLFDLVAWIEVLVCHIVSVAAIYLKFHPLAPGEATWRVAATVGSLSCVAALPAITQKT